ncbi:MAG: NADH-quinone oxidoreductase subunit M [Anaerolineales bacterium]|nr:NADH-quinone oxidoreductase subunit M [Anaerolineales bacterium]
MSLNTTWLIVIPGAPLVGSLALLALRKRVQRWAGIIAGAAALLSLVAAFAVLPALQRAEEPALAVRWIPAAHIRLSLHVDWLSLPFLLTEAAVTVVAILYSWGYHRRDSPTPVFYALLLLFALGMSGTTLADDTFLFYVFWELMLVASTILIVLWGEGERRNAIALKYFIFTHLGSLLVLVGLLILFDAAGSDSFSALSAGVALSAGQTTALVTLFLVGFCVKMAIFPLHLWLPDAHSVAPMPVTIMLAAAMLSMGTYGILRFPMSLFPRASMEAFGTPMMIAGVVSAIYGALMALAEQDIKRIVAYSSVSQMGYILFGLGTMTHDGIEGAALHVIYHAIVKALLFMCVGLIIRATGRRRVHDLGGLLRRMPLAAICMAVGVLAIAGTPPLCIFDSEWMIFSGGFHTGQIVLPALAVFGSLLTVAYALLLFGRVFLGAEPEGLEVQPVPRAMSAPTIALTALSLIAGVFPAAVFDWAEHAISAILGGGW